MKKSLLVVLILAVAVVNLLMADIPVTLQVDMTVKTAEEVFTPGTDQVTVRGSFMDELGYSGDWFPDEGPFVLSDDNQDTIYTITLNMPDATVGLTYEYKFQINDAIWEGDPNRSFTVQSPSVVVPVDYFDRDVVVTKMCVNFVNFRLDLTSFSGTGLGYFDPSTDSIKIEGFWGDGVAEEVSGASARWLKENIWEPGIYETQVIVKAETGMNPEFKAHAFPEDHFENWGWETGDNHSFTI
ncbi:MAG: carbohydrate-binding module family 20 domain-containing protein, partial [bacterium]